MTAVEGPDVGLAAMRLALGPSTLVTVTSDHLLIRTPSRPDYWDGNAIQLLAQPVDVRPWTARFRATVGALPGIERLRLLWPADGLDGPAPAGVAEEDLALEPLRLMRLDDLADIEAVAIEIVEAHSDKDWHAAAVLLRHDLTEVPHEFWDWQTTEIRAVCERGHGTTWIARRHGIPVGRVTLLHDQLGLGALDAVGTHPVYRRAGVATTLVHHAIRAHLDARPADRVVLLTEPYSDGERLYRRLGFEAVGAVIQADRRLTIPSAQPTGLS
ncbi:MAG: GNAT family N-acetyltransferase [Nitriliruptorales bacterium]|nr:GNAT family N-acetyltransferase [Nitriliruptorales bacterium]